MLVLSRKPGEQVNVGDMTIEVLEVKGKCVRLGFVAPADIKILRNELKPLYEHEDK